MQTVAGFPTDLSVVEPTVAVTVNGIARDVDEVSVTREISSSVLSDQGLTAATCDVTWAQPDDLLVASPNPWDSGSGFVPEAADALTVDMGYGSALARQITGLVDESRGSISDGVVSSSGVDLIDKLRKSVSLPPHMAVMPPTFEGGTFLPVNNTPHYTTDRLLRACGFYATPKAENGAVLSVPLMGSAWPEIGTINSASQTGFPSYPPSFINTQWGVGPNSITAEYAPTAGNNKLDKTFWITIKVRDVVPTSGNTDVSVYWGTQRIILRVTSARQIEGIFHDGTTLTYVVITSPSLAASADVFTLRVSTSGVYTMYSNNGSVRTGTLALTTNVQTTNITRVLMTSPHQTGAVVGGLQVGFYTYDTWLQPCTAVLSNPAETGGLDAVPAIKNRVALDVLKEQAAAECAVMWIDEFGVFRWKNRNDIMNATPVATLTSLDDLLDLQWEHNSAQVRSGVQVKSRKAKIIRSAWSNVTLYTGSGESLQTGQVVSDVVTPSDDESWFNVYTGNWTYAQLNRGEASQLGGVVVKDATTDVWATDVGKLTCSWEVVDTETVVITNTAGTLGTGETVVLKTHETDANYKPFRRDKPLPIIRGKGKVIWQDITTPSTIVGPANAALLEHDAGPWVQDMGLGTLADWIAADVTLPNPTLKDVPVVPDPRRQLTDVVWIETPGHTNVRLKVLITSLSISASAGNMDQTIGGRVLEVQITGTTNAELDALNASRTNAAFDTLWGDATNAALDSAPLSRG